MTRWFLAILSLFALATPCAAHETGFLNRTIAVGGNTYRYVVYVPAGVPMRRLPVILALHGSGERGGDGLLPTDVGLGHAVRVHPERFPAIVVFPQAARDASWMDSRALARATLAAAEREFATDRARVYIVGLSMGGNGAWALANDEPGRFAAAVVVCGFAGPFHDFPGVVPAGKPDPYTALARSIARLPVWIEHGDADPVVPVDDSRRMAATLTAAGGTVRYKELPGVGHNAWDTAFADPELATWLFSQRRAGP